MQSRRGRVCVLGRFAGIIEERGDVLETIESTFLKAETKSSFAALIADRNARMATA